MRPFALGAAALALAGCGAIFDVAYLLDDGRTTTTVEQRRPTGQTETRLELEAVVGDDHDLRLACEERTRSVDRAWSVTKEYQYRGGYPTVHWAAVILEGVSVGLAAGMITAKCVKPEEDLSCDILYWAIPFGADLAWSLYRALTIEEPKLVNKRYGEAQQALSDPVERRVAACPEGAALAVNGSSFEGGPLRFPVSTTGALDPEAQLQLLRRLAENRYAQVYAIGPEGEDPATFDRCAYLRAHATELSDLWGKVVEQCLAPDPSAAR